MNRLGSPKSLRIAFAAACTMLFAVTGQAGTFSFHVDVNTSSLVGDPGGAPFSLDFQLIGTGANTATIRNFSFSGGSPLTNPPFGPADINGASGNLGSSVVLTDAANFFNEFFQGFSAGTREINFDVILTENVAAPTPDAFSMAILDNNALNIPTTGPGDNLLQVNITSPALSLSNVQAFTSTTPAGVTAAASPEPGTLGMGIAAALITAGWRVRRKRLL
jgi:hypothetical protein